MMTKRKLAMPIILMLTLSILSLNLVPSPVGVPSPWISIQSASIINPGIDTPFLVTVTTNYTGIDIWGYEFTLSYSPLVLNGINVTNGNLITNPPHPAEFTAGTFDNDVGQLSLTEGHFRVLEGEPVNVTAGTGTSILATVAFKVIASGETPITIETAKLKRGDTTDIVNSELMPNQIGHGYVSQDPPHTHDVASTSVVISNASKIGPIIMTTITNNTIDLLLDVLAGNANQGTRSERFVFTLLYKIAGWPEILAEQTVTLASAGTDSAAGVINTTDLQINMGNFTHPHMIRPVGYLTVRAEASEVYNEGDTADNILIITLLIKMPGDVDGDGDCDMFDFGDFAQGYATSIGQLRYDVECDFDRDSDVDMFDFNALAQYYTKSVTYPPV